ncbi:MAG: D-methionine transport system substrate-binding protein [Streptosporangiaceae bacterium]|jgi:D-methionine transport system substrate-binding protein|nr:D-methionine transport system substrate-binding protein [Streptosporangiaceae bacterium]
MSTELHKDSEAPVEIALGRRRRWVIPAIAAAVVVIAAAVAFAVKGSSSSTAAGSHFGTDLQVAYEADSNSELAFLQYLNQKIAPSYGLKITPVGIGDGNQLDLATANGQYAANIYQHQYWLKEVLAKTHWKLTAVHPIFQWAYSMYSEKYPSLNALPKDASIALLNDPANTAQALWLLERAGKITFKPGTSPWQATTADIASNPENYHFTAIDYGDGPRVLPEVDAVIAYNMQFIGAGISQKYKIYAPPAPPAFAGQLVVSTSYLHDPQIVKLIKVFLDPRVQPYLRHTTDPRLKDQLTPVSTS